MDNYYAAPPFATSPSVISLFLKTLSVLHLLDYSKYNLAYYDYSVFDAVTNASTFSKT